MLLLKAAILQTNNKIEKKERKEILIKQPFKRGLIITFVYTNLKCLTTYRRKERRTDGRTDSQ